jgi:hypothetical protein
MFSFDNGGPMMRGPGTANELPNLLELLEASPLYPSVMLGIDLGAVFDGPVDTPLMIADGIERGGPSVCADGVDDTTFSDVRLKTDVEQVGTTVYGLPLYHFRYKTGPERFEGVMAQDVLEVMPDAVVTGEDSYYRVNYGRLGIRMTRV